MSNQPNGKPDPWAEMRKHGEEVMRRQAEEREAELEAAREEVRQRAAPALARRKAEEEAYLNSERAALHARQEEQRRKQENQMKASAWLTYSAAGYSRADFDAEWPAIRSRLMAERVSANLAQQRRDYSF